MVVEPSSGNIVIVDYDGGFDDILNFIGVDVKDLTLSPEKFNEKHWTTQFPTHRRYGFADPPTPQERFLRHLLNTVYAYWYMRPSTKYHGRERFMASPVIKYHQQPKAMFVDEIRGQITMVKSTFTFKEWILLDDYRTNWAKKLYDSYCSIHKQNGFTGFDRNTETFLKAKGDNGTDSRYKTTLKPSADTIASSELVSFYSDFPNGKFKRLPGYIVRCKDKQIDYPKNLYHQLKKQYISYTKDDYQYFFVPVTKSMLLEMEWKWEPTESAFYPSIIINHIYTGVSSFFDKTDPLNN